VLVHNDCVCVNWKLAVVKSLVEGNDGLVIYVQGMVSPAELLVSKLYPLEVSANDATNIRSQVTEDQEVTTSEPTN